MDNEALRAKPGQAVDVRVTLTTRDLDRSRCKLVLAFEPDSPTLAPSTTSLSPLASQTVAIADGRNAFSSSCPSSIGTLVSKVSVLVVDGAPERCANFALDGGPITVSTLDELNAGIVGSWHGCVTTPWVPAYWITMSFRASGTYGATGVETLDGVKLPAMYYGTDPDDPAKVWSLNDLQDDGTGMGTIDVVFSDAGSVNRDDLRQVRLMGNELRFEMFHRAVYGPLVFELIRD